MALLEQVTATLVVVGAIVGSIAIWMSVVARINRGEEIVPLEERPPVPWTFFDLILIMIAHILFAALAGLLLRELWNVRLPSDVREIEPEQIGPAQLSYMAATLLTVVFAIVLVRVRTGATWRDLGLPPRRIAYDLALGAKAFVALAAPVYAVQALLVHFFPVQHPLIDLVQAQPDRSMFFIIAVSVSLVAPLSEELIWRVLFQGWLERIVAIAVPGSFGPDRLQPTGRAVSGDERDVEPQSDNPYAPPQAPLQHSGVSVDGRTARAIPVVVSALVFALLHVGQGPAPIPLFLLALGLGYLYQRTHRLWPSVVLHFLLNTSSLAMLWLEVGAK